MFSKHSICIMVFCIVASIPALSLGGENIPTSPVDTHKGMNLCVVENNPPFTFRDNNRELTGFNVDMWNAMNIPYAFSYRHPDFPTALAALEGGYCNMVLTNISITPERMQRFILSEPYLRSTLAVMVRGPEANINSTADLADKTIAVLKGSISESAAMGILKNGELLALNSETELYTALLNHDADAVIDDLPIIQHFATGEGRGFVRILNISVSPQLYAYGFSHGMEHVRDSVNAAIIRLQNDGTVAKLYEKWFGASLAATQLVDSTTSAPSQ